MQLARVLVLLALLRATEWYVTSRPQPPGEMGDLWRPWVVASVISALFVAVMLAGRRYRHSWVVLVVETVLAAGLAFILPVQWMVWFGVGGWRNAMASGFVQPLAMAWLGVAIAVGVRQFRAARAVATGPSQTDAAASA